MERSDFSEGSDSPAAYWSPDDVGRAPSEGHVPYQPTKEETLRTEQYAQLAAMTREWAWASRTRRNPDEPEVNLLDVARKRVQERVEAGVRVPNFSAAVTEESELLHDMHKAAVETGKKQRWESRGEFPDLVQRLMDQGHGWNVRQQERREATYGPLSTSPPADAKNLLPVTDETASRPSRSLSGSLNGLRAKWHGSPSPGAHGRSR